MQMKGQRWPAGRCYPEFVTQYATLTPSPPLLPSSFPPPARPGSVQRRLYSNPSRLLAALHMCQRHTHAYCFFLLLVAVAGWFPYLFAMKYFLLVVTCLLSQQLRAGIAADSSSPNNTVYPYITVDVSLGAGSAPFTGLTAGSTSRAGLGTGAGISFLPGQFILGVRWQQLQMELTDRSGNRSQVQPAYLQLPVQYRLGKRWFVAPGVYGALRTGVSTRGGGLTELSTRTTDAGLLLSAGGLVLPRWLLGVQGAWGLGPSAATGGLRTGAYRWYGLQLSYVVRKRNIRKNITVNVPVPKPPQAPSPGP